MPLEQITEELFGYGILGVLVLVQGFIIWYLWKENKRCQCQLVDLLKEVYPIIEANNRITANHTMGLDTRNRITEGLVTAVDKNTVEIENQSDRWLDRWGRVERALEKLGA